MKQENYILVKDLTDGELLELAHKNMDKANKHLYSTIVITLLSLIQLFLMIFNYVGVVEFAIIYIVCLVFYLYHKKKSDSYMFIVDEALKELTSR